MPKGIKYGGRQRGTGNKTSAALKQVLNEFCMNEFQFLNANIERLTLSERLIFFTKVLPYVIPKCESSEVPEVQIKTPVQVIFSNKE